MLRGAEISREFFFNWVIPFLEREFPDVSHRLASGVFACSDAIGNDDCWSIDHEWGARFHGFLLADDYQLTGAEVEQRINMAAPTVFRGYTRGKGKAATIHAIELIFPSYFGFDGNVPMTLSLWRKAIGNAVNAHVLESRLYFLKHGPVFQDPVGVFSQKRHTLSEYPRDVFLWRLAEECGAVWHYGEWNFLKRIIKRREPLTTHTCVAHFCEAVMRVCFLLEGDFSPYWKWLPHEFSKLPAAYDLMPKLTMAINSSDIELQCSVVKEISNKIRKLLANSGLVSDPNAEWMGRYHLLAQIQETSALNYWDIERLRERANRR